MPKPRSQRFSFRSFIVFNFTFKSVDYFELIFVWYEVSIYVLPVVCLFCIMVFDDSRTIFWKDCFFRHWITLALCWKLTINELVYFWILFSFIDLYACLCLSQYPTVLITGALWQVLKSRWYKSSNFALVFQDCFGYSGFFTLPHILGSTINLYKKPPPITLLWAWFNFDCLCSAY